MRALFGTFVSCALTWATAGAGAQALRLEWQRGAGAELCVEQAELETLIEDDLHDHEVPPSDAVRAVMMLGRIDRHKHPGTFAVELNVLDASGTSIATRDFQLEEDDCRRVTPSIVLVAALLIELAVHTEPLAIAITIARPATSRTPIRPAAPKPLPVATVQAAHEPGVRHWQLVPQALAAFALGLTPDATWGIALGLQVTTPSWLALQLRAGYWFAGSTSIAVASGTSPRLELQVLSTELRACVPSPAVGSWRIGGCVGPAMIWRSARAAGLIENSAALRAALGASASVQITYVVSSVVSFTCDTTLFGWGKRDRYVYHDTAGMTHHIYSPSQLAGMLVMGIGVQL